MRLISYRDPDGHPALGVSDGAHWRPATELLPGGPATMDALLAGGADALSALRAAAAPDLIALGASLEGVTLLAPVARPGKIVAIGRNYREHADEEGVDVPTAPLIFSKWPSCVIGPDEAIAWDPALTTQVDYEAELAVVIGRTARRVSRDEALEYVFGYTCLNDVSARDLQFGDGQWTRGKSLDTFCPMGPALVTTDEIPDPGDLHITCRVDGELLQDARTSQMYFSVAEIIAHCSIAFTLDPGDVIASGTPAGVGIFRDPPRLLRDGEEVIVEIDAIGRLRNPCRAQVGVGVA